MFVVYIDGGNDDDYNHVYFLKEENAINYLEKMQEESRQIWQMDKIFFEDSCERLNNTNETT